MTQQQRHLIIPDTQIREGDDFRFLDWIGKYICDLRPNTIIHLGDHADMPSLSTHDHKGSKAFEGLRYTKDVEAAKDAMKVLLKPLKQLQSKLKQQKHKPYTPLKILTLGNHENRIDRAINNNPQLEGLISVKDLKYDEDWKVYPFLQPITVDGVVYSHYFPTGAMGRPCGTAQQMVSKLHQSCIAGHQQGRQVAYGRKADGSMLTCIIAGSCYLHDESYMDVISNKHWRGVLVLNEVNDGHFDEMFISLDYLRKKYDKH